MVRFFGNQIPPLVVLNGLVGSIHAWDPFDTSDLIMSQFYKMFLLNYLMAIFFFILISIAALYYFIVFILYLRKCCCAGETAVDLEARRPLNRGENRNSFELRPFVKKSRRDPENVSLDSFDIRGDNHPKSAKSQRLQILEDEFEEKINEYISVNADYRSLVTLFKTKYPDIDWDRRLRTHQYLKSPAPTQKQHHSPMPVRAEISDPHIKDDVNNNNKKQ